ncbi:MAG: MBL fold metallo-hydrolase [Sedimentisphaerales bacterium]|nr:MBL fold metallo-hydrolase [Sedimentisphaerales bacterium]
MRRLGLLIFLTASALIFAGCQKDKPAAEMPEAEKTEENSSEKEVAMGTTLQWLGHASFKISNKDKVIYIDPWKIKDTVKDANVVLVSHSHYDHYSPDDIAKISGPETKLIASADVISKQGAGEPITPGLTIELDGMTVQGVPAYNPDKQFHPKANSWVGFIVEIDSKRIYYAGDTDLTEEMKALGDITVALLPVGGTYTMNFSDAAEATKHIKPKMAIPYHWGDIVGKRKDADEFAKKAQCEVKILAPGQTINLE